MKKMEYLCDVFGKSSIYIGCLNGKIGIIL